MKKIFVIFSTFFLTVFVNAQDNHAFVNWMDTIGTTAGILEKTQYYLSHDLILIRDTTKFEATVKKDGSWKITDKKLFFEKSLPGVYDHEEVVDGEKVIWVRFRKKVDKKFEMIAIPFKPSGPGSSNQFMIFFETDYWGDVEPFVYEGHTYEAFGYRGNVGIAISAEVFRDLIKIQGILVKNK